MSGPGLEAAHGVNAARTRRRTLSARGNDGMRDGYFLLPRPGPCQRHDPFPFPARAGTHAVAWAGCTPLQLNRIRSIGLRIVRLRVRILSGAFRGRRPVAGRPVRNGKVAGSNPAGSTTCGMPPRVSADIPGNDVMSRRRAPAMEYARQRPPAGRARDGGAGRPVPRDADVVQWQHACFPSRRPRVRTPSSAPSGKPRQWIRSNNGTRSRPFHVDASGENMDEQPRHGHAASRNKETCHRPGSSEEEQVPFKHWVRIS